MYGTSLYQTVKQPMIGSLKIGAVFYRQADKWPSATMFSSNRDRIIKYALLKNLLVEAALILNCGSYIELRKTLT